MIIEVAVLLVLTAFLVLFISVDGIIKRNKETKTLEYEKSWIDYKRTLPKYIP